MSQTAELIDLTAADRDKLKSKQNNLGFALGLSLVILIIGFGCFFVLGWIGCPVVAVLVSALLILGNLTGQKKSKKIAQDLTEGKKRVVIAPIVAQDIKITEHQRYFTQKSVAVELVGEALGRETRPSIKMEYEFWIIVDTHRVVVSEEQYYKLEKGDLIEIHVAPRSGIVLSDAVKKVETESPPEAAL